MCYDTLLCGYARTPHPLPLIQVWAAWAASWARSPDCPLPRQIHQIIRGQPKMFPGQLGDSLSSGSLVCPKDLFNFGHAWNVEASTPKTPALGVGLPFWPWMGNPPLPPPPFQLRTMIPGRRPSTTCPEVPPHIPSPLAVLFLHALPVHSPPD